MSSVTIAELERDPLGLLSRVEAGESILLTRENQPVAELRPVAHAAQRSRPYGLAAGEFVVPADFDVPLPEVVLREFESP